jgi:hypothetical protein
MNVAKLNAHLSTIQCPDDIRDLPAWLVWRYEHSGETKPRKVPYYTNGQRRSGVQGRDEDRQQLTTFDAARAAAARRGMDGVGFCPMPEFNIVALDFDRCVENGDILPEVVEAIGSSYAEYSPSGQGIRAFFKGNIGNLKSHHGPFGFETFSSKGYVTFTGNVIDLCHLMGTENTIADVNDAVMNLVRQRFQAQQEAPEQVETDRLGLTPPQVDEILDALPGDLDYDTWVTVGMALHHELGADGFQVWDQWSQRSPKYTNERYGRERWRSFGKGNGRVVTARSLVKLAHDHGAYIRLYAPASPDEFDALVDQAMAPSEPGQDAKPLRYPFIPAAEFSSASSLPWIVKGVLPKAQLAVVYGASGSGKSFAVLDMALSIARGEAWRERKVRQGRVAYVAAEGADGFRKRLAAYQQFHGIELTGVTLSILAASPNLMESREAVDVVAGIEGSGGADVVVLDTFAQVTPGANENAGEDVGRAIAHCRRIHERTGALVVLIHHSGKDATKGARGWSGLRAAADAEIEVLRTESGVRTLRLSKSKDGEDGLSWAFDLQVVQLGIDEDGDPITSCVVQPAEMPEPTDTKRRGPIETVVLAVVNEMCDFGGIDVEAVLSEAALRLPAVEQGKRDTRRQRARRALEKLVSEESLNIGITDGFVHIDK